MKRITPLLVLIVVALAGCGSHVIGPAPAGSASTGDLPPKWVQEDALWQALDAGDAHPQSCTWALLSSATLDAVGRYRPGYTSILVYPSEGPCYLVIVRGHFRTGYGSPAKTLFMVLDATTHDYRACEFGASRLRLSLVGHMHLFTPRMPYSGGVWGFAAVEGGAPPGGPYRIPQAPVAVWKGAHATGNAFLRLLADGDGFFSLDLPRGTYTLALTHTSGGYPRPVTVNVVPGHLVSAGVISSER